METSSALRVHRTVLLQCLQMRRLDWQCLHSRYMGGIIGSLTSLPLTLFSSDSSKERDKALVSQSCRVVAAIRVSWDNKSKIHYHLKHNFLDVVVVLKGRSGRLMDKQKQLQE